MFGISKKTLLEGRWMDILKATFGPRKFEEKSREEKSKKKKKKEEVKENKK